MDGNYTITITTSKITIDSSGSVKKGLDTIKEIQINNTTSAVQEINSTPYTFQLLSMDLKKEMYSPGYIKANIKVTPADPSGTSTTPKAASIIDARNMESLAGHIVAVSDINDNATDMENEASIDFAKNYFIKEVEPIVSNKDLYLILHIYSPDVLFKLKKFSKCYTAKKLGGDIISDLITDYSLSEVSLSYENSTDHLQHTTEQLDFMGKDGVVQKQITYKEQAVTYNANKDFEFIHPYLVMNDESAHDFISRTANRCGEFFYYENGKLILGIDIPNNCKTISSFDELRYQKQTGFGDNSESYYERSYKSETIDNTSSAASPYTGPTIDFFDNYATKEIEDHTDYGKALLGNDELGLVTLLLKGKQYLTLDNVPEMVASFATDIVTTAYDWGVQRSESADEFKENHIDNFPNGVQKKEEDEDHTVIYQFSNFATKLAQNNFYVNIHTNELSAAKDAIHVTLKGTNIINLLLGDLIMVGDESKYIVTGIHHFFNNSDGATCEITAVPVTESEVELTDSEGDTVTATIDGKTENVKTTTRSVYPMPIKGRISKQASPQVAYVTDTDDPCSRGRIRIRYPWQKTTGDQSPWIRVATPFSSKKSGIKFMPQIDDEVIIDYEFGNIERPFMTSSVQSQTNKDNLSEEYSIQTPNGHNITFSNPENTGMLQSALCPALNIPKNLSPSLDISDADWLKKKELAGGIKISDAYETYKIEMSTDERSISIESALGNVTIDAFTGISINAPNGDVKIVGKNVSIEAGNEVKIVSGKNVKNQKLWANIYDEESNKSTVWSGLAQIGTGILSNAADALSSKFQIIDFTLLRTVFEGIHKPIGSTMTIKSNRYLKLEAGKGETSFPYAGYQEDQHPQKLTDKEIVYYIALTTAKETMTASKDITTDYYKNILSNIREEHSALVNNCRAQNNRDRHIKISDATQSRLSEDNFNTLSGITEENGTTKIKNFINSITDSTNPSDNLLKKNLLQELGLDLILANINVYETLSKKVELELDAGSTTLYSVNSTDSLRNYLILLSKKIIDSKKSMIPNAANSDNLTNAAKNYVEQAINAVLPSGSRLTKGVDFTRYLLYQTIEKLKTKDTATNFGPVCEFENDKLESWWNKEFIDFTKYDNGFWTDDAKWKKYLTHIGIVDEDANGTGGNILHEVVSELLDYENIPFLGLLDNELETNEKDQYIWSPKNEGEILLSDNTGNTIRFSNGRMTSTPSNWLKKANMSI